MKDMMMTRLCLALLLALTLALAGPAMAATYSDQYGTWTYNNYLYGGATIIGFQPNPGITEVTIPDTVNGDPVISFGSTFMNCSLTKITIPEGMTSIESNAFRECTSLTSVTIPGSVTSIGSQVFRDCSQLESVTIPEGVTSIGYEMFRGCTSLTSVTIPGSVTSIGSQVFRDCSQLESVTIPEGVTSIGYEMFRGCTSLTSVTIPKGSKLTSIGTSAFQGCMSLKDVTIPEGVTSIGSSAFRGCTSLESVTIPEGVTSIGNNAFYNCSSLKDVTIPEGVTTIGNNAFRECSSLTAVTIPEGVTTIGNNAFRTCTSLKDVTIPGTVTTIGDDAFNDCNSLTTIDFGGTKDGWNAVTKGTGNDILSSGNVKINYKGWLVTLDANGGTLSQTTVRTDEDGKVVSLPTPARTGHTFKGWLDARAGRLCLSGAIFTSPTTLEAQWEAGVPATGVTLDEDALTLKEGGTATLTAKVSPEGTTDAVVWASTDPSVATVTDGKVKGIEAGAAVVTATAGGHVALCLVTVTGEDGKPGPTPTSVELDEASLTLAVGNTATLKATVDPAGAAVTWATSDPSVVSVSGGKVTAKKAGTAIVTASAGGRLAFCVVTVTEDGKPAPGPGRIEAALVSGGEGEAHLVLSVGAEGSPKAWALLRVWLELLSLEDGGIVHASAEPGDVFGAFMAVTDGEGLMTIDVDALTWADGPDRGKRASIPAGTYRIHLAGADEGYAESVLGPTVILAATQGDGEGAGGSSGGGCDAGIFGALTMIAGAGMILKRKG